MIIELQMVLIKWKNMEFEVTGSAINIRRIGVNPSDQRPNSDETMEPSVTSRWNASCVVSKPEENLQLAAAYIKDARDGRGIYGQANAFYKRRYARICFCVITNPWFQRFIYCNILLHSFLAFFEPPSSDVRSTYAYVSVCLNGLCLLIYVTDVMLCISFLSWKAFFRHEDNYWSRREAFLIILFTIDWILFISQVLTFTPRIVQPFRGLRPAMIICKSKNIGHVYYVAQTVTVKLGGMALTLCVFIFMYSCIGVHLMAPPYENIAATNAQMMANNSAVNGTCTALLDVAYEGMYNNIGKGSVHLFALLQTDNYPNVVYPALVKSELYSLYYGTYLFLGLLLFTPYLLAIIANHYWNYHKMVVKKERKRQREWLVKAWLLLDTTTQESLSVDNPVLVRLFKILKPKNTEEENYELIEALSTEDASSIHWVRWVTQLCTVLKLQKTDEEEPHQHQIIVNAALKNYENIVFWLMVLYNILFAIKWTGMTSVAAIIIQALRTSILLLLLVHEGVVLCSQKKAFLTNRWGILDAVLLVVSCASNVAWYGTLQAGGDAKSMIYVQRGFYITISSLAIFFRLGLKSPSTRQSIAAIFSLLPVMFDLIFLFAVAMYFFAVIGVEAFHHLSTTTCSNYHQMACGVGFRTLKCSYYSLVQVVVNNNWSNIMVQVIETTGNYGSAIYFVSAILILDMIIMNLVMAIGIAAFNRFTEDENTQSLTTMDAVLTTSENQTLTKGIVLAAKKVLAQLCNVARNMFASIRCLADEGMENRVAAQSPSVELQLHEVESNPTLPTPAGTLNSTVRSSTTIDVKRVVTNKEHLVMKREAGLMPRPNMSQVPRPNQVPSPNKSQVPRPNASQVPSPNTTQAPGPNDYPGHVALSHTQLQLRRMRERWRNKVTSASRLTFPGSAELPEQLEEKPVSMDESISQDVNSGESHSCEYDDALNIRRASMAITNIKKYKKRFDHGNWRSELQNVTIINQDEIQELRKQFVAPAPSKVKSEKATEHTSDDDKSRSATKKQRQYERFRRHTVSSRVDVADLHTEIESPIETRNSTNRKRANSIPQFWSSQDFIFPDAGVKPKPLVTVEEADEGDVYLASPSPFPGEDRSGDGGAGEGGCTPSPFPPSTPQHVPEWAVKVARQYKVAIHTDTK